MKPGDKFYNGYNHFVIVRLVNSDTFWCNRYLDKKKLRDCLKTKFELKQMKRVV